MSLIKRATICFMTLMILIGLCSCVKNEGGTSVMGTDSNNNMQIKTDTIPIYNHFPTLPKTDNIEWYSVLSEGIGPTTVKLCVFAHYDSAMEIDDFLRNVTLSNNTSDIDFVLVPDTVTKNETWQEILEVPFCFQEGIPDTKLMNTKVYVNSEHTIIFIDAIGQ